MAPPSLYGTGGLTDDNRDVDPTIPYHGHSGHMGMQKYILTIFHYKINKTTPKQPQLRSKLTYLLKIIKWAQNVMLLLCKKKKKKGNLETMHINVLDGCISCGCLGLVPRTPFERRMRAASTV